MKQCSWCANYFSANVAYQIYCSPGCRDEAKKEKILERHKAVKRQKRSEKPRNCAKCNKVLSVYNDHKYCNTCSINQKEVNKKIKEIRMFFHEYQDDTE